jgi:hypothetical protein
VPVARSKRPATATMSAGTTKVVINVPPTTAATDVDIDAAVRISGLKVKGAKTITGKNVLPAKGGKGVAKIVVREGLWEHRRGHKVDGGERRRAEVQAKRRGEEKNAR